MHRRGEVLPAGDPRHGLPAGVDARCVCRRCRTVHARMVATVQATRDGVPRFRAVRRVRALRAVGFLPDEIATAAGVDVMAVHYLTENTAAVSVSRPVFARLSTAYDGLSARPLFGEVRDQLRAHARHLRYYPPLAWEDIDNPVERPSRDCRWADPDAPERVRKHDTVDPAAVTRVLAGEVVPTTRAEKETITAEWLRLGRGWRTLEQLTGWNVEEYRKDGAA